jgi:pheromone shutdown protein TraB
MIQTLKEGKSGGKQGSHASFTAQLFLQWAVYSGVFVATECEIVQSQSAANKTAPSTKEIVQ